MWRPDPAKLTQIRLHSQGSAPESVWAEERGPAPGKAGARYVRLGNVPFRHAKPTYGDVVVVSPDEGRMLSWDKALVGYGDDLENESDALAALQAAEVDRRLRYPDPFRHQRRSAAVDGFSLHAGVRVHENDRSGLERLCRYLLRPPLALQRLSRGEDGRLVYRMKRPRGGSLFLVLTAQELVARMATLVPPPRVHGVRYHGLIAPHSKERSRVVPVPVSEPATTSDPFPSDQPHPQAAKTLRTYRLPWALLLRNVFALDVLRCSRCGGTMQVLAVIADTAIARRILDHLNLDSTGPPISARVQGPPDLGEPGPDYDVADPVYPD